MKRLWVLLADHAKRVVTPARLVAILTASAFALAQMASAALTNRYVDKASAAPLEPYDAWGNAAADIQTAINYANAGETVLVAAATYDTGGVTNYPTGTVLTNRVAIWKAITVQSANNDPTNTIIKGAKDNGTNGPASVRCVYMTNGSALIGFTLTNGSTLHLYYPTNGSNDNHNGGGVWCSNTTATISNCIIVGNMAAWYGGGAYKGTLYNCALISNTIIPVPVNRQTWGAGANGSILSNCMLTMNYVTVTDNQHYGGAVQGSTLYNCTLSGNASRYGGGGYNCTLYNCMLTGNSASYSGGGVRIGTLYNCLLTGNVAMYGGGTYQSTLYNCTVVSNTATDSGGGVRSNTIYNSIVYFNTATTEGSNWYEMATLSVTKSCTAPAPPIGSGNTTDNPQFVDTNTANYRLGARSPCINTGTNGSWTTSYPYDLDGRTRIRYGTVDMGAYERLHKGTICGAH